MCSGSDAGSYLRLVGFVYHSTLGLRVMQKKKRNRGGTAACPVKPLSPAGLTNVSLELRASAVTPPQDLGYRVLGCGRYRCMPAAA